MSETEVAAFEPEQLLPMITAAINAGDPREVMKHFAEQGCFALPDGSLVRGHAELLALYEQRLAFRPKITARQQQCSVSRHFAA